MTYQRFPIETDPDALAQDAYGVLSDATGGAWQPSDGNLDTWIIEATARMAAEVRDVAADVPDAIFRRYGETLVGLSPYPPTNAQAVLELAFRDDTGYVLPAGATFGVDDLYGETHAFALAEDVTIPAGGLGAPLILQVATIALVSGADANGIDPRPGNAYLLDALAYIVGVDLVETTSGGSDGESDDDYMARLADSLKLLSPRLVLAPDFAIAALTVPGVGFAAAINLYSPGPPPATNVARAVTVALADEDGEPVPSAVKIQVDALLQSLREANFLVFEIDPGYVTVNVAYTVGLSPGFLGASVVGAVNAAIAEYLSPASFAAPKGGQVEGLWTPVAAVRYLDVGLVIQGVDGVDHVSTLTLNGSTGDVALPAPASLPRPGTISGTAA